MIHEIEAALAAYFPASWHAEHTARYIGHAGLFRDTDVLSRSINEPARDFIFRPGKRLRPILFLSLLKAFGMDYKKHMDIACLIEIVHNGTLVIDDIEDDSLLRRGLPTLHRKFGMDLAINAGMTMHFLPLIPLLSDRSDMSPRQVVRLFRIYSQELIRLYFGQAADICWHRHCRRGPDRDEYLEMCRLKTGSLMRLSVRFASVIAGRDDHTEAALVRWAETAGIAYQIRDDVLDLTTDNGAFGKSFGNDVTDGKMSLPVILALEELAGTAEGQRLLDILEMHTRDVERIREAYSLIHKTRAVSSATHYAENLLDTAGRAIKGSFLGEEIITALESLLEDFFHRNH